MFNKSLREKISHFQDSINRQSILLSEKESELRILQQKLAFSEGHNKALSELIEVLKGQLKEEMQRGITLQGAVLQNFSVASKKMSEEFSGFFQEDEEEVEKIRKDYLNQEGAL